MLSRHFIVLSLPLILCAFTHLWNPIGFPFPNVDEGLYLGRAVNFMDRLNPKDPYIGYDHPYFGQIFLAGYLYSTGYQSVLNPSNNYLNYEILLLYPRILMAFLAILDTFLLFKIVEIRYSTKAAFIASILFAVMPITWLTRWILLDSIQLPFILLSILFSILPSYIESTYSHRKRILLASLSGIFLGLSIFTKIPAFTMIPLIGYSVFNQNKKSFKILLVWIIPVILIPSIWVMHAISMGEFDQWWDAINNQTHRESRPLYIAINDFFKIDPLLFLIGVLSLIYALIKRDLFIILSAFPFLIFMYFIGYVVVFHLIFLVVIICIATGILFVDIISFAKKKNLFLHIASLGGITLLAIFGLLTTTEQVSVNVNSQYFSAAKFIDQLESDQRFRNNLNLNYTGGTTIISHPFFFWVDKYKFHDKNYYYWSAPKFENRHVISIVDDLFDQSIQRNDSDGRKFRNLFSSFNTTHLVSFDNNSVQDSRIDILLTDLNQFNKSGIKAAKLLKDNVGWTNSKDVHIQRMNGVLNITVDTTKAGEKNNVNLAHPESILHLTRPNSYLSTKYVIPTYSKDSTFTLELSDADSKQTLWHQNLRKNQGRTVQQFFIFPEDSSGKKVSLNIRINNHQKALDSIILKELALYY